MTPDAIGGSGETAGGSYNISRLRLSVFTATFPAAGQTLFTNPETVMKHRFLSSTAALFLVPWLLASCSSSFDDTPAGDGTDAGGSGGSSSTQDGSVSDGAAGAPTDGDTEAGPDAALDGSAGAAGQDGGTGGTDGAAPDASVDAELDGDTDAGGEDVVNEPYCDPLAEPADDACVIHEDFGVFVSPDGDDGSACGTRSSPCASIGQGMSRAKALGKRVYACAAPLAYQEAVVVDSQLDGITVYGGFDCSDWSYLSTTRTRVAPAAPNVALSINDVTQGVRFVDMHFTSADAISSGASSIAVHVTNSQGVVLERCDVTSGQGGAGNTGQSGTKGADGATVGTAQAGKDFESGGGLPQSGGAWPSASACGSKGGNGGGAYVYGDGDPGSQGTPTTGLASTAAGGGGTAGDVNMPNGDIGGVGTNGQAGTNGPAASTGTLTSQGYTPAGGNPGTDGSTAQGGGGGGGAWSPGDVTAPTGGAGGMGGCGGTLATGGTGGGASFGLLISSSGVELQACTVTSAAGGRGGNGGNGGQGGTGSDGALGGLAGNDTGSAGKGGRGGNGGPGGSGSGGSGGPSYAVVFYGGSPVTVGTQLTHGNGGGKGIGGTAPAGVKAPDGAEGPAATIYEVL